MPPDLACAVHARGVVGTDLRQTLNKCGAIRQIHYFLNDQSEREAFVTFKYKSDAVYAKTKHSFDDVQIFGIVDDFWKSRYIESQNADPNLSGMQKVNDYDTFMPHALGQPPPAPAGDDYLSDPAGFVVHVEGEVLGTPTDCKFTRFGAVRQIFRFSASSGKPHAFIAFENRIAAASARNAGHIDQLPIDALSRSEWMMKKYRELIEQDVPYSNGLPPPDHYLDQPPSPPGSPRNGRAQPVVYERSSWTREGDAGRQGRQGRGPPPYGPPRSRAPDTSPRRGPPRHEPPRHEPPRHFPGDERALSTAPRPVYHDELARVPVDRAPVQPYPANGTSNREPIGWKDGRDYPPPGYDRERMSPGYSHPPVVPADPRYDPIPGRPREYDDRAGRPSPREASRYSPYPPRSPAAPHYPPPPRERVPASPGYPPPLPVDVRMDDGPRRERAPSADSRRMSARGMEAPIVPLTKPLSATAPSEEALNTLKFMRDMQCQPGQYHIAAEKEPRFADAEVITLEGIKVALSSPRPSEAAPLYLFLARLQGERFKTERNPALVLRLARDVVVNLDEASALGRQPLEPAMQNLRQEMWAYTRSRASDADVEMMDLARPAGEDPDAQIQRLTEKLRRTREDARRMEDELDRERRERRKIQMQLADAQDGLARTSRAAKHDVEDLRKANERYVERIAELEREIQKMKSATPGPGVSPTQLQVGQAAIARSESTSEAQADVKVDSKEGVVEALKVGS